MNRTHLTAPPIAVSLDPPQEAEERTMAAVAGRCAGVYGVLHGGSIRPDAQYSSQFAFGVSL